MRTMRGLVLLGVLASLALSGEAAAQAPIKIGFLAPLSGAIAAAGKDMYSGCELYWQETGWQMAGRKIEVVLEDNEGQPATTLTKARKLVESDKVHLLMGVILSNVAYALVPYVEQQGIPTMYPINSADDLTQRRRPKWLIRTGFSAGGNMHPFGEYAAKTLGYKRIVTIGLDYAFGWETVGGFHKAFEDAGGQIIQVIGPVPSGKGDAHFRVVWVADDSRPDRLEDPLAPLKAKAVNPGPESPAERLQRTLGGRQRLLVGQPCLSHGDASGQGSLLVPDGIETGLEPGHG
jgi:hypothetical protein